jgi:hypothetical protein
MIGMMLKTLPIRKRHKITSKGVRTRNANKGILQKLASYARTENKNVVKTKILVT